MVYDTFLLMAEEAAQPDEHNQIVCHQCGKLLRNAAGVDLVADIYGDQDGEDVCKECHTRYVEPYIIEDDDGNVVGFHCGDCGPLEVELIEPQPELVSDDSADLNDVYTWWLYENDIFRSPDMQQLLLDQAESSRSGGPVIIDSIWYWSPVFDREYTGVDAWSLDMLTANNKSPWAGQTCACGQPAEWPSSVKGEYRCQDCWENP